MKKKLTVSALFEKRNSSIKDRVGTDIRSLRRWQSALYSTVVLLFVFTGNISAQQSDIPSQETEAYVASGCKQLGGKWHEGTLTEIEKILAKVNRKLQTRQANCADLDPAQIRLCRQQASLEAGLEGYFQILLFWQCHLAVIRTAKDQRVEKVEAARNEACQIRQILSEMQNIINASGGAMVQSPHEIMETQAGIDDLCPPCPLPEFDDLVALVRQRESEAGDLFSEIPSRDELCPDASYHDNGDLTVKTVSNTGFLQLFESVFIRSAHAKQADQILTSKTGPFPGKKFNEFRTSSQTFPKAHKIRQIQDEMSNHGGRDNLLNQYDWNTFAADVNRAMEALKIENSPEAKQMFDFALKQILDVRSKMHDRLNELKELQASINEELSGDNYIKFLESLNAIVQKNRQLEDPENKNAHDPRYALWSMVLRNLVRLAKGGVQRIGLLPVTTIITIGSIFGSCSEYLDWSDKVSDIELFKKPYMELLEFSSSLVILTTQYEARISAQEELIEKLQKEWDKEQSRRKSCKRS